MQARGFIYPASEIYGGLNGFWDYGPLGTELKNNLRDAWWHDMVRCPPTGPDGEPVSIVGLDSSIIQNPRAWEASGHVGGFNDPMVDCRETKSRYRADHLLCLDAGAEEGGQRYAFVENDEESLAAARKKLEKYVSCTLDDAEVQIRPSPALPRRWPGRSAPASRRREPSPSPGSSTSCSRPS